MNIRFTISRGKYAGEYEVPVTGSYRSTVYTFGKEPSTVYVFESPIGSKSIHLSYMAVSDDGEVIQNEFSYFMRDRAQQRSFPISNVQEV